MKQVINLVIVLSIMNAIFWTSCRLPELAGEELVSQDQPNLFYTDTLTINAKTTSRDSIVAYSADNVRYNVLVADHDDPIFGNIKADAYMQFLPNTLGLKPNFGDATLDSVVLVLEYNHEQIMGDTTQSHTIGAYRITEDMPKDETYYNSKTFAIDNVSLGSETFTPRPTDSIIISQDTIFGSDGKPLLNTNGQVQYTYTKDPAYLTLKLDDTFGQYLLGIDTSKYDDAAEFLSEFKGLCIKAIGKTPSILNFRVGSDAVSGIELHYKRPVDGELVPFVYLYSAAKGTRFTSSKITHSSNVQNFIDNPNTGDSLLFSQSLAGTDIRFTIPYAKELGNVIVNKAELELTVADVDNNPGFYPPIDRIVVSRQVTEDSLVVIRDVTFAINQNDLTLFGGYPIYKNGTYKYIMNMSAELQKVIDEDEDGNFIIIPYIRSEKASRAVFYGTKNPNFKAKIKLTYTKL